MFVNAARNSTSMNAKLLAARTTVVHLASVDAAGHSDCTKWTCVLVDRRNIFCVVSCALLLFRWCVWYMRFGS